MTNRSARRSLVLPFIIVSASAFFATYSSVWTINSAECPDHDNHPTSTLSITDMVPAQYNLTAKNIQAAQDELFRLLNAERVITDLGTRIAHSSTEWSPAPGGDLARPHIVVHPVSTEEVSAIAKICHRRQIPMIAFSGGTSLEGTLAATHGGVCIDFARMNSIIAVHGKDMDVVVQPGVGYTELNERLAHQGFFFPPDPGPGAQIGGMVS